jgi:hypothetical protein
LLTLPPPIEGDKDGKRYDSVHHEFQRHFIVYDNTKAYPGYLVTYINKT